MSYRCLIIDLPLYFLSPGLTVIFPVFETVDKCFHCFHFFSNLFPVYQLTLKLSILDNLILPTHIPTSFPFFRLLRLLPDRRPSLPSRLERRERRERERTGLGGPGKKMNKGAYMTIWACKNCKIPTNIKHHQNILSILRYIRILHQIIMLGPLEQSSCHCKSMTWHDRTRSCFNPAKHV